jgi:thioredoxin-related protein
MREMFFATFLLLSSFCVSLEKLELKVFLGPKECPWSEKFSREVLDNLSFRDLLQSDVNLYICDFSATALHKKYGIEDFPAFLLTEHDEKIAQFSYLPLEARAFAHYIRDIVNFHDFLQKENLIEKSNEELKVLYQRAKGLKLIEQEKRIIQIGCQKDGDGFFLLEKYAALLRKLSHKDPQLEKTRKKISLVDPQNKKGLLFQCALLDFDAKERIHKKVKLRSRLRPLLKYVKEFRGSADPHLWKAEMMIAGYLSEYGKQREAQEHAKHALQLAPSEYKAFVEQSIKTFSKN